MKKKTQINENQLLADAELWFKQKYGKIPQNQGVEFIKIWHKPTPFVKTLAVVFAPTEEIGKAFIREQNIIFRTMGNVWFLGAALVAYVLLTHFLAKQDIAMVSTITTVLLGLSLCCGFIFFYLARKCKKCEEIHQWNVEVYYPNH